MTQVSNERLEEMLAGLEWVTPGPWDTTAGLVRSIDGEEAIPIFESREPWKKHRRTSTVMRQEWHNRQHIARCDPDTMRSILTELLSLRQSHSTGAVVKGLPWVQGAAASLYGEHSFEARPASNGIFVVRRLYSGAGWTYANTAFLTAEDAKAAAQADYERRVLSALSPVHKDGEPVAHPDDEAVDRFAAAMKAKLAKKRAEGRGGWENKDEYSAAFLSSLLHGHVIKGDPVDVANLAMMLHQRGESILQTPNSAEKIGSDFVFSMRTHPKEAEVTVSRDDLADIISKAGAPPGPPDGPIGALPKTHFARVQAYKQADAVIAALSRKG